MTPPRRLLGHADLRPPALAGARRAEGGEGHGGAGDLCRPRDNGSGSWNAEPAPQEEAHYDTLPATWRGSPGCLAAAHAALARWRPGTTAHPRCLRQRSHRPQSMNPRSATRSVGAWPAAAILASGRASRGWQSERRGWRMLSGGDCGCRPSRSMEQRGGLLTSFRVMTSSQRYEVRYLYV